MSKKIVYPSIIILLVLIGTSYGISLQLSNNQSNAEWTNPIFVQNGIQFKLYYPGKHNIVFKSSIDNWESIVPFNPDNEENPRIWSITLNYDLDLNPYNIPDRAEDHPLWLEGGQYEYKIRVDGMYMADPHNPETKIDSFGNEISVFNIDEDIYVYSTSPVNMGNGKYRFVYSIHFTEEELARFEYLDTEPVHHIFLTGSFNHWDTFSYKLDYYKNGIWTIDLYLNSGDYCYNFVVDNQWELDPYNEESAIDPAGHECSRIQIP